MENLCTRHGISKGMMYHYYSNKDELFLLCVQDVFQNLKAQIEQEIVQLEQQSPLAAIREFFLLRERYFQQNPERERIFETALLHPPRHLMGQIGALHAPIRDLNKRFIAHAVSRMPLRPGLTPEDCESAFVPAAAWMVLAWLQAGEAGVASFTAGNLTIHRTGQGAAELTAQAERLMAPYLVDGGFSFQGVAG